MAFAAALPFLIPAATGLISEIVGKFTQPGAPGGVQQVRPYGVPYASPTRSAYPRSTPRLYRSSKPRYAPPRLYTKPAPRRVLPKTLSTALIAGGLGGVAGMAYQRYVVQPRQAQAILPPAPVAPPVATASSYPIAYGSTGAVYAPPPAVPPLPQPTPPNPVADVAPIRYTPNNVDYSQTGFFSQPGTGYLIPVDPNSILSGG